MQVLCMQLWSSTPSNNSLVARFMQSFDRHWHVGTEHELFQPIRSTASSDAAIIVNRHNGERRTLTSFEVLTI